MRYRCLAMTSSALKSAAPLPIRSLSAGLTQGLGVVPARFVKEMIVGIHRAQSLHLTDIARSLGEDVELHATIKRLSRNLTKTGLTEIISTALLERAAREVTEDMILVVSCYDLPKRFANRMEYARGSAAASQDDGYYVCDISATDPASPDYHIPLLSRLWSRHAPDYQSDATEILTAVNQVYSATEGRGVFYCPEVTMDWDIHWSLMQAPNLRTMLYIRNHDSAFMVDGQLRTVSDLASSGERPYRKLMFKMVDPPFATRISGRQDNRPAELSMLDQFGKLSVQLDIGKQTTLILERKTSSHDLMAVDDLYLATGITADTRDQLRTLLQNQYLALDMNTAAVNHKSRFNQSDVRVLTYDRLQLLNVLLQAVTYYEAHVERTFSIKEHAITSEPHPGDHPRDFQIPQTGLASTGNRKIKRSG